MSLVQHQEGALLAQAMYQACLRSIFIENISKIANVHFDGRASGLETRIGLFPETGYASSEKSPIYPRL
jgi:hypothetical protein